jgi:small redox-active disulfide protein 2
MGCPKCKKLFENAEVAAKELNIQSEIIKVTDIDKITEHGVMMTPALVIDGEMVSSGKVLNKDEIKEFIAKIALGADEKNNFNSSGCCSD